jgi:putative ABC transport system ATP-binding protein
MSNLALCNASYTYRNAESEAVRGADCEFEQGTLYAIVGPSGSGKSTLLSLLAGLDAPTKGEVHFGGENLTAMDLDAYRREKISMIFQAFHLFPLLTVMENVCYPLELGGIPKREARERAKPILERMGISVEKYRRFPSNLSGGEQQRTAIARALATGAKTLIADEPTGNLDTKNTANIMEILRELAHADGYCVIVVTHDSDVAASADVVFRMRDGVLTRER